MEVIEWFYLLAVGIVLIGIEALFFSFFLVWVGIGFLVVSALTYTGLYDNGVAQIASACVIGLILVFALRKWSINMLNRTQDNSEGKVHKRGIGTIDNGMIRMDGTYWQSNDDLSGFQDGDKVEIIDVVNNKVILASQN